MSAYDEAIEKYGADRIGASYGTGRLKRTAGFFPAGTEYVWTDAGLVLNLPGIGLYVLADAGAVPKFP